MKRFGHFEFRGYELFLILRNFLECEDVDGTSIDDSSKSVCIQLSKMSLILCLLPNWMR